MDEPLPESVNDEAVARLLGHLNEPQQRAATHGQSPLLIIAGAGTGKTTTLTHRVAWLIHKGVDPRRVLLLTFTRRSAAEMLSRASACLMRLEKQSGKTRRSGASVQNALWGGTFHAMASRLLRQHGRLIGLEPEFSVLDRSD
jgi:DNA helicase-2/ATP-dependent DNA helicase PcrA